MSAQIDQLKEQFAAQQAQSQQRIEELERTNKLLREQVDAVLRRFFGSRTKDSIDPAQLEMAMKGLDVPEALSTPVTPPLVTTSAKRRGKAKRRPLPDNLPTETIVIDPAEVLASPEDWWDAGCSGLEIVTSLETLDEIARGESEKAKERVKFAADLPLLEINDDVADIANDLVQSGIVPDKAASDAIHIAVTSVHRVEFLVTWIFKHIANPFLRKRIRDLITKRGFQMPTMCSPKELLDYDEDN